MRLRLGKVTVADVLAAQPVTTNLLKFMRASINMIGVSNLQSFIASMTQKLTLSDISDESKNYLDKAGITTACLRIFFSSRRRHTRYWRDWSSDVCYSDLVLLRAAEKISRTNKKAVFVIVGGILEQDYFAELQGLAETLNISTNIRFAGRHQSATPFLQMSNVFALPSRSEGFSNALLEAMAAELPCVATDVGGNSEAIQNGLNGLIVEPE